MFRLHIYDNNIEKIKKKSIIFKSNNIDFLFTKVSYEIKRLRILNDGVLYIIYFGTCKLEELDFDESGWITTKEKIEDIVYEVSDGYGLNKYEVDDSDLLTDSEKIYIINNVNQSKGINDNWVISLFIDKNLALIGEQEFIINSDLKYLSLNIIDKYEGIISKIEREYQIAFFDNENIPF